MNRINIAAQKLYKILTNKCKPIHYKSKIFSEVHELFSDTKKTFGKMEAFRQSFGHERNRNTGIENGFIFLKEWKKFERDKLFFDFPESKIVVKVPDHVIDQAYNDFTNRKPYMVDKGLPDEIRINGFIAEHGVLNFFKNHSSENILPKVETDIKKYCDHDFIIRIDNDDFPCDVKSKQSKRCWNVGRNIQPKRKVVYVFTSAFDSNTKNIIIYGYAHGFNLLKINYNCIKENEILDIHYLLGAISYRNKKSWLF